MFGGGGGGGEERGFPLPPLLKPVIRKRPVWSSDYRSQEIIDTLESSDQLSAAIEPPVNNSFAKLGPMQCCDWSRIPHVLLCHGVC